MTLQTERDSGNLETVHGFDLVIDGSGADAMWFAPLLSQDALDVLELGIGAPLSSDSLQRSIGYDLAVTGVAPKLFLPNLSWLTQGPRFPTTSAASVCSATACWVPNCPHTIRKELR